MPVTLRFAAMTDLSDTALFDAVFALYETSFPENERHAKAALIQNLAAGAARRRGRTVWLTAVDDDSGKVLGACSAYVTPGIGDIDKLVTMSYLFVAPESRGQKLGPRIEQALVEWAGARSVLLTCDIEDPQRMLETGFPRSEYEAGVRLAGITPFRRMVFWRKLGYRPTAFPYVLKVNRPDAEPTRILKLYARLLKDGQAATPPQLPSVLLRDSAAFINAQCDFSDLPEDYRAHPDLAPMWVWPDANPHCLVDLSDIDPMAGEAGFADRLP